ncbi:MAG: SCP2 sterol-binding domain-containing protein [Halobacteria archaeon]
MGRLGPTEGLMVEGLVKVMDHGIRTRLEQDREARRWVRSLRRTVVLELEGVGSVTVRFRSGRVGVRPGTSRRADYRLRGPYDDLVGYMNGEVGLSELLAKMATGKIRVDLGPRRSLRELWTILRLEDIFVITRKREPFPVGLVDVARRAALCVPRTLPLVEAIPL